jgi:DNA replication protein DnaC
MTDAEIKRAEFANTTASLARMGLPPRALAVVEAGNLRETAALKALRGDVGLTALSGGAGSGKTVAAVAWLHGWAVERCSVVGLFVSSAAIARWERYDDREMGRLFAPDRLVIDDLGAEFLDAKGAYLSVLDELVNERYSHKRATVLTTNLPIDGFRARYGERIADRIRESGKFISTADASMRGAK